MPLDQNYFMIDFTIMKTRTATVADLRNNFRRLSGWLENGEEIEIVRRGRKFARLIPARDTPAKLVKIDFKAQLESVWGDKVFTEQEVRDMREAELGTRS
jgi:antitoxin (DNA-binding transcriptional repressor) of toxin-antitoxin stability system